MEAEHLLAETTNPNDLVRSQGPLKSFVKRVQSWVMKSRTEAHELKGGWHSPTPLEAIPGFYYHESILRLVNEFCPQEVERRAHRIPRYSTELERTSPRTGEGQCRRRDTCEARF